MQVVPEQIGVLANELAQVVMGVEGVVAVVVGGSYSRGRARPDSDVDIGLLYSQSSPLDVAALRESIADVVDASDGPLMGSTALTELGGWGPWVNGGGWLTVDGQRVDLLYRSIDRLEEVIADALVGVWHHDFRQQPPYGFWSVTYLGEVACCIPIVDPTGTLVRLKAQVAVYPPALRRSIISGLVGAAEFSLRVARGYLQPGREFFLRGMAVRMVNDLVQVLFALNEVYFVNDKTALDEITEFRLRPVDFAGRVLELFRDRLGSTEDMHTMVTELETLHREVLDLAGAGGVL